MKTGSEDESVLPSEKEGVVEKRVNFCEPNKRDIHGCLCRLKNPHSDTVVSPCPAQRAAAGPADCTPSFHLLSRLAAAESRCEERGHELR